MQIIVLNEVSKPASFFSLNLILRSSEKIHFDIRATDLSPTVGGPEAVEFYKTLFFLPSLLYNQLSSSLCSILLKAVGEATLSDFGSNLKSQAMKQAHGLPSKSTLIKE